MHDKTNKRMNTNNGTGNVRPMERGLTYTLIWVEQSRNTTITDYKINITYRNVQALEFSKYVTT